MIGDSFDQFGLPQSKDLFPMKSCFNSCSVRGCSSVAERRTGHVEVGGSNPFTRFLAISFCSEMLRFVFFLPRCRYSGLAW